MLLLPSLSYAHEDEDTIASYNTLQENGPQHINVSNVPRFALLGKEGKYFIGIGADIKVSPVFDFGSVLDDPNYFVTSAIPMNHDSGNGGKFQLSAQQSNIYINVVALPGTRHQIGAYVQFSFQGKNYLPKLAHAYLKYHDVTAGFTYTIFGDISAAPATIDYEGPNAMPAIPHAMIAYEPFIGPGNRWRVGVALDMPEYSFTNASLTSSVSQRLPDVPFYVQYLWDDDAGWLRLSGMVRNLYYRNLHTERNIDKLGWGLHASGMIPFNDNFSASFAAVYGRGISSYIDDLNGEGMDLMPSGDSATSLKAVEAWGAYGSLRYDFSSQVFSTATYSHVRAYVPYYSGGVCSVAHGDAYSYAQYIAFNTFYKLSSMAQVGVEYLFGRRVNQDGKQTRDNRVEGLLRVSF